MARALVEMAKAADGPLHITFRSDADILIRPLVPQATSGQVAAMGDDPLCAVSGDAGMFGMRGFLDCARDARARDGDVGSHFHLKFDDDANEVHLRCMGDCPTQ